jgi:hypothetical protein
MLNQAVVALARTEVLTVGIHNLLRQAERLTIWHWGHGDGNMRPSQARRSRSSASRHWSRP